MADKLQLAFEVKDSIELTDKEALIFSCLKDVLHHFNLSTQLRVAGGWVRDKLLGKDSDDIDVAIDNMLGREFCEKITEYLTMNGEDVKKFGVVKCNPDQSKHLETAKMHVFGLCIDFVNLRSEDYCQNSRIPTMRFGTPEEDAYRRDLTINSLFYNINNDTLEDFTGRGLTDLKLGKIVTPLPPKETFLDDPLRVLRAIRFGARFNFVLDEELKEAAASDEVRAAIAKKISRERIGHEVDLIIGGSQPVRAVTYLCDLQLFWIVFGLPSNVEPSMPEACDRLCLSSMDRTWRLVQSLEALILKDEHWRLCIYAALFLPLLSIIYKNNKNEKDEHWRLYLDAVLFLPLRSMKKKKDEHWRLCLYASLFLPLRSMMYRDSKKKKDERRRLCLYAALFLPLRSMIYRDDKKKKIPAVDFIFRNSLKLKVKDAETVISIHRTTEKFGPLISYIRSEADVQHAEAHCGKILIDVSEASKLRILIGLLLREIKGFWPVALLLSTLLYPGDGLCESSAEDIKLEKCEELYKQVEDVIVELGLKNIWEAKHLVNGTDIMGILNLKPGPIVKEWQQKVIEWQLAYPYRSGTADECQEWLREQGTKRAKLALFGD